MSNHVFLMVPHHNTASTGRARCEPETRFLPRTKVAGSARKNDDIGQLPVSIS